MSVEDRPYIACRELLDFLDLYLEDELPAERRLEFDRHLAVCEPCREYIRQYRVSIRLGRASFDGSDDTPEDAPEDLIRAVLRSRPR